MNHISLSLSSQFPSSIHLQLLQNLHRITKITYESDFKQTFKHMYDYVYYLYTFINYLTVISDTC